MNLVRQELEISFLLTLKPELRLGPGTFFSNFYCRSDDDILLVLIKYLGFLSSFYDDLQRNVDQFEGLVLFMDMKISIITLILTDKTHREQFYTYFTSFERRLSRITTWI